MDSYQILTDAQNLIREPKHWMQGEYAKARNGRPMEPNDHRACKWCSIGAVLKVLDEDHKVYDHPAMQILSRAIDNRTVGAVPEFNDSSSHEEVMEMFDRARSLARASA